MTRENIPRNLLMRLEVKNDQFDSIWNCSASIDLALIQNPHSVFAIDFEAQDAENSSRAGSEMSQK